MNEILEPSICELVIVSYDGDIDKHDGSYSGQGVATMDNKCVYDGDFKKGMPHGEGVFTWPNNVSFSGSFNKGIMNGKGLYKWPDGSSYEGDIKNGKRHGNGVYMCSSGQIYEGEWKNGKRHGKGRLFYNAAKTCVYEGYWCEGLRHHYGIMKYASGNAYEGEWTKDKKNGKGVMVWVAQNEVYSGQWKDDLADGFGEHIWGDKGFGKQVCNMYRGEWKGGVRDGLGTFFYSNGSQYSGYWFGNKKDGRGVYVYPDGRITAAAFKYDRMCVPSGQPRASDDVNPQYKLNVTDVLACVPNLAACLMSPPPLPTPQTPIPGAPTTTVPPSVPLVQNSGGGIILPQTGNLNPPTFEKTTILPSLLPMPQQHQKLVQDAVVKELERLLLRYNSYTRIFYRRYIEIANSRTANDKSLLVPPAEWSVGDKAIFKAKAFHSRLFCMTLAQLKQFAREIGLVGPKLSCHDVAVAFAQMKAHHREVALSMQVQRKQVVALKRQIETSNKLIAEAEKQAAKEAAAAAKEAAHHHHVHVPLVDDKKKKSGEKDGKTGASASGGGGKDSAAAPPQSTSPTSVAGKSGATATAAGNGDEKKPAERNSKTPLSPSGAGKSRAGTSRLVDAGPPKPTGPTAAIEDGDLEYEISTTLDIPLTSVMEVSLLPTAPTYYCGDNVHAAMIAALPQGKPVVHVHTPGHGHHHGHYGHHSSSSGSLSNTSSRQSSFSRNSPTAESKCMSHVSDVNLVDIDPLHPILEREFVEMIVRLGILFHIKNGTSTNSPINDITDVLAVRMQPLTLDWTAIPAFVRCFHHDSVQQYFNDHKLQFKYIWFNLVMGTTMSDTASFSEVPTAVPLRKLLKFLLSLKGQFLIESITVNDLLVELGRVIELPRVNLPPRPPQEPEESRPGTAHSKSNSRPVSPGQNPGPGVNLTELQKLNSPEYSEPAVVVDFSVFSTMIDFDDFKELFARVLFNDALWLLTVVPIPVVQQDSHPHAKGAGKDDASTGGKPPRRKIATSALLKNSSLSSAEGDYVDGEVDDSFSTVVADEVKLLGRLNAFILTNKYA